MNEINEVNGGMYCGAYGVLEWLEPEDFYTGPWSHIDIYYVEPREERCERFAWDIVENVKTGERRYTNV